MAANAQVIVELVAQTAKFESDMKRVSANLQSGVAGIQKTFAALGVALSVGAFTAFVKGAIDAADHLGDLSKATGVAATTLGGIGFAAKQAGADLDGTVKAFGKLNLYVAEAVKGNADAVENFRRLGISLRDLQTLKPDQIFVKVAAALEKYEDGPQKAALANAIFKKSYQEMLPLLGEGAAKISANIAYWQKYSGVTEEMVKQADEFNDTLGKLKLLTDGLATSIASNLLGPMQAFADAMVTAREKGGGFKIILEQITQTVKDVLKVANAGVFWIGALADAIDSLDKSADAFMQGNMAAAQEARQRFLDQFAKDYEQFVRQQQRIASGNTGGATFSWGEPDKKPKAPATAGAAGGADKWATLERARLQAALKEQQDAIKTAQDQFKNIGSFIEAYYDASLIGMTDYFNARQIIISAGLSKEVDAYNKQIAALQESKLNADPKGRIEIERQIAEAVAARGRAETDAVSTSLLLEFKRTQEAQKFKDAVEDITIALAAMNGEDVKAATLGFEKANRERQQRIQNELGSSDESIRASAQRAQQELKQLEILTVTQAKLSAAGRDFGNVMTEIADLQQHIDLQAQAGALTSLEAMEKKADLARAEIPILREKLRIYEELAATLPAGPAAEDAVAKARTLRREIEKLGVAAEATGKMFTDIFTDAFTQGLTDIVTGTKSVSDAFKDMEKQIVAAISRIAAQNIAEALFGKSGALGGGGFDFAAFMAKLFGAGAGGYATGPGMPQLGGPGGGLASGTDNWRGGSTWVGERGPEIVNLPRGSQVIPAERSRQVAGSTNVFHINVLPGASRASATQAAAAAAREARIAAIRTG